MRDGLWRAACALAAACGLAFGLWAGAGIARAEEPDALTLMRERGSVLPVREAATEPRVGDRPAFRAGESGTRRKPSPPA